MAPSDDEPERHRPTRRQFLIASAVAVGAGAGVTGLVLTQGDGSQLPDAGAISTSPRPQATGRVPALDSPPDRAAFAPEEQRCAPYLVTLAAVANSVDVSGTDLNGYFHGGWWREPAEPFNARTSELVHTLSWFASHERPWNPYFQDPDLLARLDAALGYYLALQHESGAWPEYSRDEESRAATSFAMTYLTKTLVDLRRIDALPTVQRRIVGAVRSGMRWFLDPWNEQIWTSGPIELSNQVLAGFAGCAQSLREDPDPELSRMLAERIDDARPRIQSAAGFLYESLGMDIDYNLSVALVEIAEVNAALGQEPFVDQVRELTDWLGLVLVPEPDGAGFIAFDSASARNDMPYLNSLTGDPDPRDPGLRLAEQVGRLFAFYPTAGERAQQRDAWRTTPGAVAALEPGRVNPRNLANLTLEVRYPTAGERAGAFERMSPIAKQRFTTLRRDDAGQQDYLFVRRPGYYLPMFLGERPTERVQAGLGLLWHPSAGTFVHAGSEPSEAWSVIAEDGRSEATERLVARYVDDVDQRELGTPGAVAGASRPAVSWAADDGLCTVALAFADQSFTRSVTATAPSVEQIPLLVRDGDVVQWDDGTEGHITDRPEVEASGIIVTRGSVRLHITWGQERRAMILPTDRRYFRDGSRRTYVLRVPLAQETSTFRFELGAAS